MKKLVTKEQKENEVKYKRYKRLIRSLRWGRDEKISPKQIDNHFTKK